MKYKMLNLLSAILSMVFFGLGLVEKDFISAMFGVVFLKLARTDFSQKGYLFKKKEG